MCVLSRFELAELRAKKLIIDNESRTLQQVIKLVSNDLDKSNISDRISAIIDNSQD